MKKLLILGGSYQHIKIVKASKELGVKTYVTDYLPIEQSPAKAISDVPLMYNITDIDALEEFCLEEHIDGIMAPYLDITQIPYQQLCERLGYYCFGNRKQHEILTNKIQFKDFCQKHGVDIIETYTEQDILDRSKKINFPIYVKPNDSRGSRGQTICKNFNEVDHAIKYAKEYSTSNEVIIEKYIEKMADIQLVYMVINKEPILIRVEDRYLGSTINGLDKLCIATIDPSRLDASYREKADRIIKKMIKELKLKNSPIFIQAFFDGKTILPYDPGIRLPGDDFDDCYKFITGIDIPKILVNFALTGKINDTDIQEIKNAKINKPAAMILPCLKSGKIARILGYEELKNNKNIISMSKSYKVGDYVENTNNVKQRFGEFCMVYPDFSKLKAGISELFLNLKVLDEQDNNMLIEQFDVNIIERYKK